MRVLADGTTWLVLPRHAVWIPAWMRHSEQLHGPASVRTLYFAAGVVRHLPPRSAMVGAPPLVQALIDHVCGIGPLDRKVTTHAHLLGVLIDQLAATAGSPPQLSMPRDRRARHVADLLQDRPDHPASVGALAGEAGTSRRTIERLFVAETAMTIGEWRRQLRLLHGVRLLASGATVADVARRAGYASPSAFIAAFKKKFGTTPGRY